MSPPVFPDELSAQDGLIFKGQRCVIPLSLRTKIKEKLHGAHTGIQSRLRRARETVYWPGMNSDLTDHILKCDICSSYQSNEASEPLISHKIAEILSSDSKAEEKDISSILILSSIGSTICNVQGNSLQDSSGRAKGTSYNTIQASCR